jgi:transaldolase/glucose-6-phosphate isomerase
VLSAVLGEAYAQGRNKLTLLADPQVCPFGSWLEQLVAESSGKDGRGIVPVDMEPYAQQYGPDRLFVYFRMDGEREAIAQKILEKGQPVITLPVADTYDLGPAFYEWEVAVAIATAVLGVNGFNQPDVQDNKTRTNEKVALYRAIGRLDEGQPIWEGQGGRVYGQPFPGLEQAMSLKEVIAQFLEQRQENGYVAINAYLPRNAQVLAGLQELRKGILSLTGQATTLGFGPRFLHSTGQLHKGGPENALFLQITQDPAADIEIPGEGITFGVLERAQAVGDLEALLARNRRAIRVHLTEAKLSDLI